MGGGWLASKDKGELTGTSKNLNALATTLKFPHQKNRREKD